MRIPIGKTAIRLARLAGLAGNTVRAAHALRARSRCEPAQDQVRGLQEEDPRKRARCGAPPARGRRPPLLPHSMHRGGAGAGDGGARCVAYDRSPRRGGGELMVAMEAGRMTVLCFGWRAAEAMVEHKKPTDERSKT